MDSLKLIELITDELENTKGQNLVVLDLRAFVSYTDYFVLVTGTSDRHVQAMAERVRLRLKNEHHLLPFAFEGLETGQWILLDYGDVVLHLFQEEQRGYYDLDHFWADAPVVIPGAPSKGKGRVAKPRAARPKKKSGRVSREA